MARHKELSGKKDLILTQDRKPNKAWTNYNSDSFPSERHHRTDEEIAIAVNEVKATMKQKSGESLEQFNQRAKRRDFFLIKKTEGIQL